jgi:hypothetical protein
MKKHVMGIMICLLVLAAGAAFAQTEESDYPNFSTGQRWGTWALNEFVLPGIGSYVIMNDILGGTVQVVVGGVGEVLVTTYAIIVFAAYFKVLQTYKEDFDKYHDNFGNSLYDDDEPQINWNIIWDAAQNYIDLVIAGGILAVANTVFNIVRSATYDKPPPKVGSLADPNAWSIVVLPGDNGAGQVQLAYTLRF